MGIKEKSYEIRYLTHMIVFPDEDTLVTQKEFIHDLQFELGNWKHQSPFNNPSIDFADCSKALLSKGEYKFQTPYPPAGFGAKITHWLMIENNPRACGWFGSKDQGSIVGAPLIERPINEKGIIL